MLCPSTYFKIRIQIYAKSFKPMLQVPRLLQDGSRLPEAHAMMQHKTFTSGQSYKTWFLTLLNNLWLSTSLSFISLSKTSFNCMCMSFKPKPLDHKSKNKKSYWQLRDFTFSCTPVKYQARLEGYLISQLPTFLAGIKHCFHIISLIFTCYISVNDNIYIYISLSLCRYWPPLLANR